MVLKELQDTGNAAATGAVSYVGSEILRRKNVSSTLRAVGELAAATGDKRHQNSLVSTLAKGAVLASAGVLLPFVGPVLPALVGPVASKVVSWFTGGDKASTPKRPIKRRRVVA